MGRGIRASPVSRIQAGFLRQALRLVAHRPSQRPSRTLSLHGDANGSQFHNAPHHGRIWRAHCPRLCKTRSEEQTSELQSAMRITNAVFCLKKKQIDNREKV